MSRAKQEDDKLLAEFVAAFDKLDDLRAYPGEPVAWEFASGDGDAAGFRPWRPLRFSTDRSALDALYGKRPARFPPLYEQLVLSYRWAEVDLGDYRLLANPFEPGLDGLLAQIRRDPGLWDAFTPNGYLQFGRGPGGNYDPVCFASRRRRSNGDCPVVQIDHEEILCNRRIKEVAELAPGFRELVLRTIEAVRRYRSRSWQTQAGSGRTRRAGGSQSGSTIRILSPERTRRWRGSAAPSRPGCRASSAWFKAAARASAARGQPA